MKHMPVLFIYDAFCDEIYCATNISGSDALEIAMSAIEEDVMETQRIEYYDLPLPKPDWWRVEEDYQKEVDRLRLMDSEFYMHKFNAYTF